MRKDLEIWLRGSENPRPAARGLSRRGFVVPGGASEWGLPVAFFPDLPATHEAKSSPPAMAPGVENNIPENTQESVPEETAASRAKAADFIVVDLEKPVELAEPAEYAKPAEPKEAAAGCGEALAFIALGLEKLAEPEKAAEPVEEAETDGYAVEVEAEVEAEVGVEAEAEESPAPAEEIKPDEAETGDFAEGDLGKNDIEESNIEETNIEETNMEENGIEENDIGEDNIDKGDESDVLEDIESVEAIEEAEEPSGGEEAEVFDEPVESETFDSVELNAGEPSGSAGTAEDAVEESERAVPEDLGRRRNESAFEERLRRIEMARRSASRPRRSGFRYRYGRFVAAGVIALLVVGTVFLTYNHLRRNSYGFLMENAKTLYESGRYEESLEAYREISLMYPNRVDPFMGLALASERAGRIEEAVEAYKCVLDLEPFFDFAQSELTRISEKAGDAE